MNERWPHDLKKTKARLRVLAVLEAADRPLSAAEISERAAEPGKTSWFSTVYRTLQTFMQYGLVAETTVAGSEMRLFELVREQHQHYARCERCQRVIPIDICPIESFQHTLEGFRILSHRLELSGICRACERAGDDALTPAAGLVATCDGAASKT